VSYITVDCDTTRRFNTSVLWQRLFKRFAKGDIIRFGTLSFFTRTGIFYNTYKMTNEQIHVQVIVGWGDSPNTIKVAELLLWEHEWKDAKLIRGCEEFNSLYDVMDWWKNKRERT